MKVLSQLCSPECCLKIQLRRELKFNEKSIGAASWVRNCSHGHRVYRTKQGTCICYKCLRTGNELNKERGVRRKKWQPVMRFGFGWRYHNLPEKGNELGQVGQYFPSPSLE